MDVLDPGEVAGHPLTVPNGPTSEELGAAFLSEEVTAVEVGSREIVPHLRSLTTAPAHVRRLVERFPLTAGRVWVLNDTEAIYVPSRSRRTPPRR